MTAVRCHNCPARAINTASREKTMKDDEERRVTKEREITQGTEFFKFQETVYCRVDRRYSQLIKER